MALSGPMLLPAAMALLLCAERLKLHMFHSPYQTPNDLRMFARELLGMIQ